MANKRMVRRAVYPGTFDPVTNGHMSLIERASRLFDELVVAVAKGTSKNPAFTFDERLTMMAGSIKAAKLGRNVSVVGFDGMLADLVHDLKAVAIIRGLRAVSDFEYEFQMGLMNRKLARDVETVFLMPSLSWVYLSSSIVKDVARNGGEIRGLVPPSVKRAVDKKYKNFR